MNLYVDEIDKPLQRKKNNHFETMRELFLNSNEVIQSCVTNIWGPNHVHKSFVTKSKLETESELYYYNNSWVIS